MVASTSMPATRVFGRIPGDGGFFASTGAEKAVTQSNSDSAALSTRDAELGRSWHVTSTG